jgi:hypothetical protein
MSHRDEELVNEETREGFSVRLYFAPEYDDPAGHFASGDDDADAALIERIRNGSLLWFVAHVEVSATPGGPSLGDDYLGGCCYESAEDFMEPGGYYDDMVNAAIEEARGAMRGRDLQQCLTGCLCAPIA